MTVSYRFKGDRHPIRPVSSEPTAIVNALFESAWFDSANTPEAYMIVLSDRVMSMTGDYIPVHSPEAFIDALILKGYLLPENLD